MPVKKKAAKKRAYNKRNLNKDIISNIELLAPPEPINPKKDNELAELTMICDMFDNMTHEQKQRNLKYLCARYYDFL